MSHSKHFLLSILSTLVVLFPTMGRADACRDLLTPRVLSREVPVKELSLWRRLALKYEMLKGNLILRKNEFRTDRALLNQNARMGAGSYESYLGAGFVRDLRGLRANQHWLDVGAGEGQAARDYYQDASFAEKASVTAISVQPPTAEHLSVLQRASKTFRSLTGRLFEAYSPDEIERADIITDVMGALHYSHEVDVTLTRELESLKIGGRFYTQTPDGTRFFDGNRELSWIEFLSRVEGIRVIEVPGTDPEWTSLAIVRTGEKIVVPRLELIKFKAGEPPNRVFRMRG